VKNGKKSELTVVVIQKNGVTKGDREKEGEGKGSSSGRLGRSKKERVSPITLTWRMSRNYVWGVG